MDLKKKILDKFNLNNIQFEQKHEEIVSFFQNKTDFVPYLNSIFRWKFNLEQIKERYSEVYDFSGLLKYNNKNIGFWPLTYIKDINEFSSYGSNIINPLFEKNIDKSIEKSICNNILVSLHDLSKELEINELNVEENFNTQELFISNWHNVNLGFLPNIKIEYQIYANLDLGYNKIKSLYRKSYKSLINNSKKKLKVKVLKTNDKDKYSNFKELHKFVSGRQTRSDKSWELNFLEIRNSNSYLFYIENDEDKMIGGSIINCTNNEAYYAIGAYDKSFFKEYSVSHLIQDFIIDFLCKKNFKWYNLGEYDPISYKNDKKLHDISKFKMGFGTNLKTKYIFNHKI